MSESAPVTTPCIALRVVVADDNRDAAETLAMLLKLDGHEVRVAHDGSGAVDVIASMHPQVAVLDIGMPYLNGYQVAERVRDTPDSADVVLVALTAWGQPQDLARARAAGFDHYLVKPADPGVVRSLLRRIALT